MRWRLPTWAKPPPSNLPPRTNRWKRWPSQKSCSDIRDLGAKETERAEISPRSRKNPPKNEAEKARREKRDAELKAEIAEIESRLEAGGLKAKLVEVGPVAAASVLDYFASPAGKKVLARIRELGIKPRSARVCQQPSAAATLGDFCRQDVCADRHAADADARGSHGEN